MLICHDNRIMSMNAIITEGISKAAVKQVEVPKLAPRSIKVKVLANALNPTDWKHLDYVGHVGSTVGSDFVGTVVEKAPDAGTSVQVGDRVAGCVHGGWEEGVGAFADYVVTVPEAVVAVPEAMKTEEAAGLGVAGFTALFGLFQDKHLGLPEPTSTTVPPVDPKLKVLVWSGASSVGQFVIQLARLIGAYVIVTASKKHEAWLKSLGAAEVHDYADAETPKRIADAHPDIKHAFDTYSMNGSQETIAGILTKEEENRIVSILSVDEARVKQVNPKSKATFLILYTVYGKRTEIFGAVFEEDYCKQDAEYLPKLCSGKDGLFYKLLSSGAVKPNRTSVQSGGFSGMFQGLDAMRQNKVSGEKLVYPHA